MGAWGKTPYSPRPAERGWGRAHHLLSAHESMSLDSLLEQVELETALHGSGAFGMCIEALRRLISCTTGVCAVPAVVVGDR